MSGHHGIDSFERYRLSRSGFDGDAMTEGPEIGGETSDLDDCTPGLWQAVAITGLFTMLIAACAGFVMTALWAGNQP